jgi:hypothetical protein
LRKGVKTLRKIKKLLTLEDLAKFCKEQNFSNFSSKDTGYQLSVQVPANFEVENADYQDNTLLFGKVKVFHIGPNRNGSSVTKQAAEKALSTIAYKPLLANFCEVDGVKDFTSHDITINDDGTVNYIEHQIGCFTADTPVIQYDETTEKEFIFAKVAIPREYTDACGIIERKNGTKVSVELIVNEMNYSAKDDILELTDIIVQGCTCLGTNPETGESVEEGMQGARLDIADFSIKNNSVTAIANTQLNNTLIETLKKLNETLEKFNDTTNSEEKGGDDTMDKFNELLNLYGLTEDEIDFEVEGLSDEELEAAFTEAFGDAEEFKKKRKCSNEDDDDPEEDYAGCGKKKKKCSDDAEDDDESDDEDFAGCGKKKKKCSVNSETGTVEFQLSFDEIRMALYGLLNANIDCDSYAWICEVYDDHFIYQKETYSDNGYDSKYYKQSYSKTGEDVSLSGDAVEVFTEFVTESEKTALDMIRSQYEELKAFKDQYEAEQLKVQREEILESAEYEEIKDTDEFKSLVADADKYSVDELKVKADLLFADAMKKKFNFAAQPNKKHSVGIKLNAKPSKKGTYGNLFADK